MQRQAETKIERECGQHLHLCLQLFWSASRFCLMPLFYGSIFLETSNPIDFLPFFAHVIRSLVSPQAA